MDKQQMRIELIGHTEREPAAEFAVYAVDRANKLIETARVDAGGNFKLSPKALSGAAQVLIGPVVEKFSSIDKTRVITYRAAQFKQALEASGVIELAKNDWYKLLWIKRCVSGSVKHCYPWPLLLTQLVQQVTLANIGLLSAKAHTRLAANALIDAVIAKPGFSKFPHHCDIVCDGLVEIYRRTCCCTPWVVFDPRLPDLVDILEKFHPDVPVIKWPPRPEPDPSPFTFPFFKSGAIDEMAINADADLHALKSLPIEQIPAYINARAWLRCSCGSAAKVAQGSIRPDGEFNICWSERPHLMLLNCHEDYAYIIKQNINGISTVIYDGVAAHQWYHYSEHPTLTSHHPQAQSCRHDPFPNEEGAFVLLQDIGMMGSYNLKTPDATDWNSVGVPAYNDGLAFPAANAIAAKGVYRDRNWGGSLLLRYHFSEPMKAVGAKYYRVSVVASDSNGNPTGTRTYLPASQWRYYEIIGTDIYVNKQALGPHNAGTQNNLYEIPYDADRDWQSGQYHAVLDTTQFANGRFLFTVEVFDAAGKLLRPQGTTAPVGVNSAAAHFTFRRWYQETGPTAEVPFAALTHMLWWDNRKADAEIVDLRKDHAPNTAECQFILGTASSNFSLGYRAYHPEPMFLLDHRLWWHRGLGTATGVLTSPNPNPDNVGVPPNPPHESAQSSFGTMLGGHSKCSFTVNLHSNVKTFNGIGTLDGLDGWDQAAFALDISGPCIPLKLLSSEMLKNLPALEQALRTER